MNPELPKSVRSVLARQGAATTHPSADLLTAFAEHTLTAGEKERVADHLAGCSECREVLFLASNVDEQPSASLEQPVQATWKPRPRWMALAVKTVFVASGLVIVASVFLRLYLAHENSTHNVVQVAQVTPQQPPAAPQLETASPPATTTTAEVAKPTYAPTHAPQAKLSEAGKISDQTETATLKAAPAMESSAAAGPAPAQPANQPPPSMIGGIETSIQAAAPMGNSFADNAARSKALGIASAGLSKQAMVYKRADANPTWRTTSEGRLEHLAQSGWTPVLADHPTKFRAVSQSPNGIWAGGSHAELFHSDDGGAHWKQVALPVPPDQLDDAIVAINFTDLLHGLIATENGVRYTTSDGGKQWQRE